MSGDPYANRVLGWDLLRGCCAYAVVIYHLLAWQKIADVHSIGFYAVYVFFVLSGASLTLNYYDPFVSRFSLRHFGQFLLTRFMRLAPLFYLLVLLSLPWKITNAGFGPELASKLVSNLGFVFGFGTPLSNSMIVGGWSLGIEFVFYLIFPIFLIPLAVSRRATALVMLGLLGLQVIWIFGTVSSDASSMANLVAYHQIPAFSAYFFGGCILGYAQKMQLPGSKIGLPVGVAGIVLAAVLFVGLNTAQAHQVLFGWRAVIFVALCFFLVWWTGRIEMTGAFRWVAQKFGDVTYGVYLIHPFLFFGITGLVIPRLEKMGLPEPSLASAVCLSVTVMAMATLLAYLSERWLEKPVRQWVRRYAGRGET